MLDIHRLGMWLGKKRNQAWERGKNDCCTLFMPKNPATKARLADVRSAEDALPIAGMVDAAVERAESKEFVFP